MVSSSGSDHIGVANLLGVRGWPLGRVITLLHDQWQCGEGPRQPVLTTRGRASTFFALRAHSSHKTNNLLLAWAWEMQPALEVVLSYILIMRMCRRHLVGVS